MTLYFLDLSLIHKDELVYRLDEVIGYAPVSFLSEKEKYALTGIAYLRSADVFDPYVSKEKVLEALRDNPHVLDEFKRFLPFVELLPMSEWKKG